MKEYPNGVSIEVEVLGKDGCSITDLELYVWFNRNLPSERPSYGFLVCVEEMGGFLHVTCVYVISVTWKSNNIYRKGRERQLLPYRSDKDFIDW